MTESIMEQINEQLRTIEETAISPIESEIEAQVIANGLMASMSKHKVPIEVVRRVAELVNISVSGAIGFDELPELKEPKRH